MKNFTLGFALAVLLLIASFGRSSDDFASRRIELNSPANGAVLITPSDSQDLPITSRGIWLVGAAGNVSVIMADGSQPPAFAMNPGDRLPLRVKRVLSTGTTATNLVDLY